MLDEMRTFLLVAETGSVQAAAEAIPLTQPAVTRRLQRLEQMLGAPLFDQRTKPARLTAAGEMALSRCRAILTAVDDLRSTVAGAGELRGHLRFGVSHALAGDDVADVVEAFGHRFPGVTLQLTSGASRDLITRVARRREDAALVVAPDGAAVLGGRVVGAEPLVLVAPRALLLPRRVDLRAASEAAPSVVSPDDGCDVRRALEASLAGQSAPLRVAAEVQEMEMQLSLIERGAGIGLFPKRRLRREALRRRALRVVSPSPRLQLPIVFVSTPRPAPLARAVDALAEMLSAAARGEG
jgi:DNA-binding transcriptional LysR family regulator